MKVKWWQMFFDGNQLWLRTPWFAFQGSYGGYDLLYRVFWWGMRWQWRRNPTIREGDLYFLEEREVIFRMVTEELLYIYFNGIAAL